MGTQRAKAPAGATKKEDKYTPKKAKRAVVSAAPVEALTGGETPAETAATTKTGAKKSQAKKIKHGQNYQKATVGIDKNKIYPALEALLLLKKSSYTKFDPTVEAHFKLGIDPAKNEQQIRANLALPHGTGKEIKILLFSREAVLGADVVGDESLVGKIETGVLKPGRDFQAVVATPDLMPKIARLGKILGPKGLMPNPRAGTVSTEPEKVIARLKKGQLSLKNELGAPLLHTAFGKLSFTEAALFENLQAIYNAIKNAKPAKTKGDYLQSLTISSTMGPGIKVDLASLK